MQPPLLLWIVSFSANSLHGATLTLNQLSNSYSSKGGQLKRVQIGHLRNQRLEIWWKRSEGTQWEGGSQRGRKVSWMFKSLFEKPSRAHVVSKKARPFGGQTMITDYRGEKWRGAGSSIFFFFENFNAIPFLLKKWECFIHAHPHPKAFSPSLHPGPGPWLREEGCRQRGPLLTSIISVGVGQAWPEKDWRENPFSSAEWGLHIPSFPHDNPHLPAKKTQQQQQKRPILCFFCSTPDGKMG